MASRTVLGTILLLRVLTVLTLAASVVLMGLNNYTDDDGNKIKFTDLLAYRYVLAAGGIGFLYTLIQIPFAIYNLVKEKRWIRNGCLPEFDFFGDQVTALLLASGAGAGFGVTIELKRAFTFDDKANKYLNMGKISTLLLLIAADFMLLLIVFSANRRTSSGKSDFSHNPFSLSIPDLFACILPATQKSEDQINKAPCVSLQQRR